MAKKKHMRDLEKAFGALRKRELQNLVYHLDRGTEVLCGDRWREFTDGIGGG